MITHEEIHAVYTQGPEVVLALVESLFLLIAHDRPFIGWDALGPLPVLQAAKGL